MAGQDTHSHKTISMMILPFSNYHRNLILSFTGVILCMCPANERRRYIVTSSLIGWAHAQDDALLQLLLVIATNFCTCHGHSSVMPCYVQIFALSCHVMCNNLHCHAMLCATISTVMPCYVQKFALPCQVMCRNLPNMMGISNSDRQVIAFGANFVQKCMAIWWHGIRTSQKFFSPIWLMIKKCK